MKETKDLPYGQRVRIAYILHGEFKGQFSIRSKVNGRWKVTARSVAIEITDAKPFFKRAAQRIVTHDKSTCGCVTKSGARVRDCGVRSVHAFVEGTLVPRTTAACINKIVYNPYRSSEFHHCTKKSITVQKFGEPEYWYHVDRAWTAAPRVKFNAFGMFEVSS